VVVLPLAGELHAGIVREVGARIEGLIAGGVRGLVVNLGGVRFVDSAGFACLIESQRRLRLVDGELVLSAPARNVADVLNLLRLEAVLRVFPDDEAALAYFEAGGGGVRPEPEP